MVLPEKNNGLHHRYETGRCARLPAGTDGAM
jgi:hypothetical protein